MTNDYYMQVWAAVFLEAMWVKLEKERPELWKLGNREKFLNGINKYFARHPEVVKNFNPGKFH